ncbi:MAG: hypothetical protein ACRC9O_09440 [Plesiomonas sp.]|uniref:hypothetical protein n=1 Tax=Plesiomonas sp. TaxID=2486279 RepID=UPI003F34998C
MSQANPSSDTIFTLYYNYYIEVLTSTLFRRLAQLLWLCQTLLAAILMMQLMPIQWGGFLIFIIIQIQIVYRPTGKAAYSGLQANRYNDVLQMRHALTDDELSQHLQRIARDDSLVSYGLCELAYNCAAIATGEKCVPLTGWVARLLGRVTFIPQS